MSNLHKPYRDTPERPEKTPHQIADDLLKGRSNCTTFSTDHGQVYIQRLHDNSIELVVSDKLRFIVKPETTTAELDQNSQEIIESVIPYEEVSDKFDPIRTPEQRVQQIESLFQRYSVGTFENMPILACKYGQLMIHRAHATIPATPATYSYEITASRYRFHLDEEGKILNAVKLYTDDPVTEREKILNEALQSATISQKKLENTKKRRAELAAPKSAIGRIAAWVSEKVGLTTKKTPKALLPNKPK